MIRFTNSRTAALAMTTIFAFVLTGCSGGSESVGPEINAKVSGKVTHAGQPVSSAIISFQSDSLGTYGGPLGDDGSYSFDATVGDFKVTVSPSAPSTPMTMSDDGKIPEPPKRDDIPQKYRSAGSSDATATITEG